MLTGKREKGQSAWARRLYPVGGVASGGRSASGAGPQERWARGRGRGLVGGRSRAAHWQERGGEWETPPGGSWRLPRREPRGRREAGCGGEAETGRSLPLSVRRFAGAARRTAWRRGLPASLHSPQRARSADPWGTWGPASSLRTVSGGGRAGALLGVWRPRLGRRGGRRRGPRGLGGLRGTRRARREASLLAGLRGRCQRRQPGRGALFPGPRRQPLPAEEPAACLSAPRSPGRPLGAARGGARGQPWAGEIPPVQWLGLITSSGSFHFPTPSWAATSTGSTAPGSVQRAVGPTVLEGPRFGSVSGLSRPKPSRPGTEPRFSLHLLWLCFIVLPHT